jgi:hypothetical protein
MTRTRRPRLAGLVIATAIVLAGPWTAANADDWPGPGPNPAAGHGVILADVTTHSAAGVGFRFTLKKEGEVDLLWRAGLAANAKSDQGLALGADLWNVGTHAQMFYGYEDVQPFSSDSYLDASGRTVADSRGSSADGLPQSIIEQLFHAPAGTYDVILWTASNARDVESRFRLQAPKGSKLVRRTVSTRTFRLGQRQFSGTASVKAEYDGIGGSALVNETAHLAVRNRLYGAFALPSTLDTGPSGSYTGPTGTHQVQQDALFNGAPAGAYSFTADVDADWEPVVAGVDMSAP